MILCVLRSVFRGISCVVTAKIEAEVVLDELAAAARAGALPIIAA